MMLLPLIQIPEITIYTIFFIAYIVTVLSITAIIISENRNPVKSLAWITVLVLLPVVGIILYIFFGRNFKSQRMISRRNKRKLKRNEPNTPQNINHLPLTEESKIEIRLGKTLTGADYFPHNGIRIFTTGKEKFESFINDIKAARYFINIQYYIFENDDIGHRIKNLLIEKAQEGLKVRVIYDHVGCFRVNNSFYEEMNNAGVEVKPFMRVTFPQFATRINWRNHRKVTIIDGEIGYIGGMNIADRYITGGCHKYWRDTHIRITGPAVAALQSSFAVDWNFMGEPLIDDNFRIPKINRNIIHGNAGIQLITSGPMGTWSNISMMLFKAIANAKRCIYIQTPYFLPTDSLLKALQTAALSKLDVRIMIPRKSDSRMLTLASYSYIKGCLNSGIKVYLYEKGMLHCKTLIIDDELSSTGSTNFDFRSMEHNFEGNVFIYDKCINSEMKNIFIKDISDCSRINITEWKQRSITQRAKESLVRLLSPVL